MQDRLLKVKLAASKTHRVSGFDLTVNEVLVLRSLFSANPNTRRHAEVILQREHPGLTRAEVSKIASAYSAARL